MTIKKLQHQLRCLGWKAHELEPQADGRWWVLANSCGHTIYSISDTRQDAWSTASKMAMKLTFHQDARPGPISCSSPPLASRSGGGRVFVPGANGQLMAEYGRLNNRICELLQEWDQIDKRMGEIERELKG